MSKFTKKCMAIRTLSDTASGCHTFLCKFLRFKIAVSQWKLAWLIPNLGILWISVCSLWLCKSIVANPIIYRLVPRPSRFEIRQCIHSLPQRPRSFWSAPTLVPRAYDPSGLRQKSRALGAIAWVSGFSFSRGRRRKQPAKKSLTQWPLLQSSPSS